MFCTNCGKKISASSTRCPVCGAERERLEGGNSFWDMTGNAAASPVKDEPEDRDTGGEVYGEVHDKTAEKRVFKTWWLAGAACVAVFAVSLLVVFSLRANMKRAMRELESEIAAIRAEQAEREEIPEVPVVVPDTFREVSATDTEPDAAPPAMTEPTEEIAVEESAEAEAEPEPESEPEPEASATDLEAAGGPELVEEPVDSILSEGDFKTPIFTCEATGTGVEAEWQRQDAATGEWQPVHFDETGINEQYGLCAMDYPNDAGLRAALFSEYIKQEADGWYRCRFSGADGEEVLTREVRLTVSPATAEGRSATASAEIQEYTVTAEDVWPMSTTDREDVESDGE